MILKNIILIKIIFIFLIIFTMIACAEKTGSSFLNEETKIKSASEKIDTDIFNPINFDNQQISTDITPPHNVKCTIFNLDEVITQKVGILHYNIEQYDETIIQATAVWNNNIKQHEYRQLRGYQYVWNIYGQKSEGFLHSIDNELFISTSITFNKQDIYLPIKFLVRSDYNDIISEYSEIICSP